MAYLTLEDGTIFKGESFGAKVDIMGEVVFNTGMTGYQEVLTDPSYCGQIVTMTYPMIGNYGIDEAISESAGPQVRAFVMRELCKEPSNWNCKETLQEYLERYQIVGLAGIDTRELTRKLRDKGTMHGIITQVPPSVHQIEKMKVFEVERPVDETTCTKKYQYCTGERKVAVLDFGLKRNILRSLEKRGCALTVFPARTNPQEILAGGFDGLMLTNGPGDPKVNTEIIENLKQLIGKLPIFGICLGHQLVALAMGADTEKLKYGHRGANHPVKDMQKNKVYITSQNHGYTIMSRSLPACAVVSHKNWNDQTIEGVKYIGYPMFTVQFHPEAAPGPEDTAYLFDEFIEIIDRKRRS
ncbi:carbamoyl phosphate synthase small subunit [Christensenella intestinihominis]|uniref:carbamoyl phosphate synthase small subunit n=1 Tax=Christensenella intestinihominis TaxID=1851429 RepID=UPI0008325522|nr:carbamoyl phosphate synthase small subunit [Christensenella intestinihominis]